MESDDVRIEYVEARRVLLDVLGALTDHLGAVVLVGAQAVYRRGLRATGCEPRGQRRVASERADTRQPPSKALDKSQLAGGGWLMCAATSQKSTGRGSPSFLLPVKGSEED